MKVEVEKTINITLPDDSIVGLTENEAIELRDLLLRTYPLPVDITKISPSIAPQLPHGFPWSSAEPSLAEYEKSPTSNKTDETCITSNIIKFPES